MDVLSFLHKIVVYRHFSYFQYGFKMAANGHATIFIIIVSNESFIAIGCFWRYSVLNPYTLNIQESLKQAWH